MKVNNVWSKKIRLASIVLLVFGVCMVALDYVASNPGAAPSPLNSGKMTEDDFKSASTCAHDVLRAQSRQGFAPSRSDLFYTEWRCDINAREAKKSST